MKRVIILAAGLMMMFSAKAYYFPVQANLVWPIGLPPMAESTNLRINAVGSYIDNVYGLDAGLVNWAGQIDGVQIGIVNIADRLGGVQLGLLNFNFAGFPVLPLFNIGLAF